MRLLPKVKFFLLLLLMLPLILSERVSAGDISINLISLTSHSVDISWESYPEAISYTVYYDYTGGLTGTCVEGPNDVGDLTTFSSGEILPCGASVFFIIESDNGGLGTFTATTDACTCEEADVTGDCLVNESDLEVIRDDMGKKTACAGPFSEGDVDQDGAVDETDTAIYNSFVGQTCLECSQETHTECQATSCVSVVGSGANTCASDLECCVCPVESWVSANCGEGSCDTGERMEYCNPVSCDTMYRCVSDSSCLGTLRGRVYMDVDRNGSYDSGTDNYTEYTGISCVGASVLDITVSWTGVESGSTTVNACDPNPYFQASLPPGNYLVSISLPVGYASSTSNPLSIAIHSQEITQAWFGVIGGGAVTGRVWNNTGGSNPSCADGGSNGLIRLVCATGSGICVTSDSSGHYTISNVPLNPGGLEVCVTPWDGWRTYCASKSLIGNCAGIDSFDEDAVVNFGLKQEPAAWFRVTEGDIQAGGVLFSFVHSSADPPYLIQGPDGDPSHGFGVVTAGNQIDLNNREVSPAPHDWYQSNYDFGISFKEALQIDFDSLFASAGADPLIWQGLPPGQAKKLSGKVFGGSFHPIYSLDAPGVAVFLAEGDVTIRSIEKASWSPPNSHILLIVKGSVTVDSIGNPFSSDDKIDASIIVLDDGSPAGGRFEITNFDNPSFRQRDRKIKIRGMIYAENGLNLPRDRYRIDENLDSVESFEYQPFFITYAPSFATKRRVSWREIP
ncbi:hypothetical protein COT51_00685 [candidate division WWE3 bacterium CG08_land_8_20_14_0_20_41_15]|uniref:Uncharacterized protein n=1 Tax=candidate division WWE3 bacterium CG08_land_8_20_14_0_20_41_15 TaxID=1975086 RepID=A0A2H0XA54_UNCKA|nr:MAG: hypothetical protein COT51_00685 [candidate division WWE3 bacterium CG08_land_8_20_14_0_20_41_15]